MRIFWGQGAAADAFVLAFKLPNLFRRLTAEGALTNAFLPAYSLARKQAGADKALVLATEVQGWLFLSLSLIVLVMELSMGSIISVLAPGFSDTQDRLDAAIMLAHITMPYLVMISLVALWAAICHADDDFVGGAAAPVILNICLIAGALMIPASQSYYGYSDAYLAVPIAFCVLLAGMMQMILFSSGSHGSGGGRLSALSACQNRVWLCGCISACRTGRRRHAAKSAG